MGTIMGWEKCVWKIAQFDKKLSSLDLKHCSVDSTLHSVEKWKIYSHPKNISSNQLFSNFVSKSIVFTKFLPKKRESSRVNFRYFHSVHCTLSVEETSICFHEITEFFAKISWRQLFQYNNSNRIILLIDFTEYFSIDNKLFLPQHCDLL